LFEQFAQHFERLPSKGKIDGGIANLGGTGTAKEEEERAQTCKVSLPKKSSAIHHERRNDATRQLKKYVVRTPSISK
jgi:hypothetical protein